MRTQSLLTAIGGILALMLLVILAVGQDGRWGPSAPPTTADRSAAPPAVPPLPAGTDTVAWAARTADAAGIPERTLQAYGNAELLQRARTPDCGLSWATLAGIGRVETRHATFRGSEPGPDGRVDPPIVGIALDGSAGTRRVTDTDGGRLDGDPVLDRAVGPMQFLPGTWDRYGADGNGDGETDPQQVDDAALAAAGLLCAGDRDVDEGADWWSGVLAYNASTDYARDVWSAAADYATETAPTRVVEP